MPVRRGSVDAHAHLVPARLLERLRDGVVGGGVQVEPVRGGSVRLVFADGTRARPLPAGMTSVEERLRALDARGVERQLVATWMDVVGYWLPAGEGATWARAQNDALAEAHDLSRGRLLAVGTLALQDVDASLAEIGRATELLGIRAFQVGTNVLGRDLDDLAFEPLWAEMERRRLLVLLHPFAPAGAERMQRYFLEAALGNTVETTLAAAQLIFGGVLDRHPLLEVSLPHGGGFLPYQVGRLDRAYAVRPECREGASRPPSAYLSRFYYDTVLFRPESLRLLTELVGVERLLYGSDDPFALGNPESIEIVEAVFDGRAEAVPAVLGGNLRTALRLDA